MGRISSPGQPVHHQDHLQVGFIEITRYKPFSDSKRVLIVHHVYLTKPYKVVNYAPAAAAPYDSQAPNQPNVAESDAI